MKKTMVIVELWWSESNKTIKNSMDQRAIRELMRNSKITLQTLVKFVDATLSLFAFWHSLLNTDMVISSHKLFNLVTFGR